MICRRLCSTSASVATEIQASSRIVTGIQPTGIPHVGNYLGFIQNFVRLQNVSFDLHIFINKFIESIFQEHSSAQKLLFHADYHSISVGLPPIGQVSIIKICSNYFMFS
jgi:tryptophanyl-tRNA synthetase